VAPPANRRRAAPSLSRNLGRGSPFLEHLQRGPRAGIGGAPFESATAEVANVAACLVMTMMMQPREAGAEPGDRAEYEQSYQEPVSHVLPPR
jgi:hypothetical protein